MSAPAYAELHCLSDFSFLRGAATAKQLFRRAKACSYAALAITDECSLAGIVRAFEAAQETGVPLIVGSEFTLTDGTKFVLLVEDQAGYETLCVLITLGRHGAKKSEYRLMREDFDRPLPGLLALWVPGSRPDPEQGYWVRRTFSHAWLAVELHRDRDDVARLRELLALADQTGLRPIATGDVHMDIKRRRALQDTITSIRQSVPVAEAGAHLFRNGERHLRRREVLAEVYPPDLLAETLAVAARCTFQLGQLKYRYPKELVPNGETPASWLRKLTEDGIRWRWPKGESSKVRGLIEYELQLIGELQYEAYFLTVHDLVRHARSLGILCQGRGSAANSAVCFALGVTEVDPTHMQLLMERFISKERNEPPDIDIDFEHERREEVIQYIYAKYGRDRAALTANVICYRGRSAARDVAKALGFPRDQVNALSHCFDWWQSEAPPAERLIEAGFDPETPVMRRLVYLVGELIDHPRHLSQHVGGFVISDAPLSTLVPTEPAAMENRTVIQWNKDDLDVLGLLKVDCLALGMLTCVRKALDLLRQHRGHNLTPATIPADDPATYAMIQKADTVGVFQIESRAQMSMLPRMKPKTFYDLVIEVAIVRPGPIQGKMVHPYLRRRQGLEPVSYPSEDLREVFERTLGVPLFQEQVMKLAIVAAGYTPGEADQLRRSMAAWKRHGDMEIHHQRITEGMLARGYSPEFAAQIFEQIKGFASYGFPESHACSFALITYVSCWLKCHEPAAFTCALLNAQPMGFYSASSLLQDIRRHGVEIREVDATRSDWGNTLEDGIPGGEQPAIRLGFRQIKGFPEDAGHRISEARRQRPFAGVADLCMRAALDERTSSLLAEAGALKSLAGHRHDAHWTVAGLEPQRPLFDGSPEEDAVALPVPTAGQDVVADYRSLGLTLGTHPVSLLRDRLRRERCLGSADLQSRKHGSRLRAAGLVTMRQRPATASGAVFVTLEDEAGVINVVVWRDLAERQRRELVGSRLLAVDGKWERVDGVEHLIASRLHDMTPLLGTLETRSRDFR
ncbi:error-prone DNA polymerase [Pseudoxanthomonas broegbernensis]|uniref:Error-prone DNA polymerase n=1 Tax=Pseudoxanthomonas broegbernensis TaxID=83619 RepID=A0A7V8GPW6_9GAMM|nr:error-prone DNA polymerase [Pseudoxanthomonas broegbernensis]KAF1687983.1 error-prone DNA polymerase [Pseudoxanthomonas broegbernensis]MBB6064998.1 error-prone DNA polymerase [Pseudoxanthomonas broegbernensis]